MIRQMTPRSASDTLVPSPTMMIEQPDVDQPEGVAYAQRDAFVGKARLGNARRVVVGDDHRRRVPQQRLFHDLARIDAGTVDRAAEQLFELDQPVTVVELW